MRFISDSGMDAGITSEGFTEFTAGGDNWLLLDKLYVAPESLQLLEPKAGDILQDKFNKELFKFNRDGKRYNERGIFSDDCSHCVIILRNDTAFMWPEVEQ